MKRVKRALGILSLICGMLWPADALAAGCQFQLGFATLASQLGPTATGQCMEGEIGQPDGSVTQRTTQGAMVWLPGPNGILAFTAADGTKWFASTRDQCFGYGDIWDSGKGLCVLLPVMPAAPAPAPPALPSQIDQDSLARAICHGNSGTWTAGPAFLGSGCSY